jgi:MFS family permease
MVEPYFSVGVPYIIKEYLTFMKLLPDYILAISNSATSVGLILMSIIIAAYIGKKYSIHQLLKIACFVYIIISIGYFLSIRFYDDSIINESTFLIVFIGINFIAGLSSALINAPLNAAISKYVDPNQLGKVVTLMDSVGGVIMPLSLIAAGFIIDYISVYIVIYLLIIGMFLMTFVIFKDKYIGLLE